MKQAAGKPQPITNKLVALAVEFAFPMVALAVVFAFPVATCITTVNQSS